MIALNRAMKSIALPAVDCSYLPAASGRVYRGGSFYSTKTYLAAA